jgi:hypothetical protein
MGIGQLNKSSLSPVFRLALNIPQVGRTENFVMASDAVGKQRFFYFIW